MMKKISILILLSFFYLATYAQEKECAMLWQELTDMRNEVSTAQWEYVLDSIPSLREDCIYFVILRHIDPVEDKAWQYVEASENISANLLTSLLQFRATEKRRNMLCSKLWDMELEQHQLLDMILYGDDFWSLSAWQRLYETKPSNYYYSFLVEHSNRFCLPAAEQLLTNNPDNGDLVLIVQEAPSLRSQAVERLMVSDTSGAYLPRVIKYVSPEDQIKIGEMMLANYPTHENLLRLVKWVEPLRNKAFGMFLASNPTEYEVEDFIYSFDKPTKKWAKRELRNFKRTPNMIIRELKDCG